MCLIATKRPPTINKKCLHNIQYTPSSRLAQNKQLVTVVEMNWSNDNSIRLGGPISFNL